MNAWMRRAARTAALGVAWLAAPACNTAVEEPEPTVIEGDLLLVVNKADATVWGIDLATDERVTAWGTPLGPHEVVVSPNGRWAVISIYGASVPGSSVGVLDMQTLRVWGELFLGLRPRPHGIAFVENDVVAVTSGPAHVVVLANVGSGTILDDIDLGDADPHTIVVDEAGERAWTANPEAGTVSELDLIELRVVREITVDPNPEAIALSPDATRLWVGSNETDRVTVIDTETGQEVGSFTEPGRPVRMTFLPDGSAVIVTYLESGIVRRVDAETLETTDMVEVGGQPVGTLVHPDGEAVFIALGQTDEIVVLNPTTLDIERRIETGAEPDGMAFVRRE